MVRLWTRLIRGTATSSRGLNVQLRRTLKIKRCHMIRYGIAWMIANNHHLLTHDTTTRINKSGRQTSLKPPSKRVNWLVFGYMEEPKTSYAVIVENIVLKTPVKLIIERHTDGKTVLPLTEQYFQAA